jgi:hypothetical protein
MAEFAAAAIANAGYSITAAAATESVAYAAGSFLVSNAAALATTPAMLESVQLPVTAHVSGQHLD